MRANILFCSVLAISVCGFSQQIDTSKSAPSNSNLIGYSNSSAATERQWEQKFQELPSPDLMRQYMQRLSARPHAVGQPYDKENADWLLSQFKQWGFDAHLETYYVLFPTPKERALELVAPTKFTAKLQEPPVPGDPTSNQTSEQLPTYNAYAVDGDVTAPLVYVNYGLREDYEELDRMGVSVKGAIVIARYGKSWRGIKPKVAAEHGAVGCIIYSDPFDDGYSRGDVFPVGPMRPREGVQRGSVMDTDYPGDPLTPGYASTKDAKRVPISEAKTIIKIPVLPISYSDAQPLLAAIGGRIVPDDWAGSLPITYHVGPGPARVHLKVTANWDIKPINDVVATIRGSQYPDEWVLRGNHYDAWVNGAEDPISGMIAELEEARSLGELVKQGWRPKRTITYMAWDGEEPGLLGSTEFVEDHLADLRKHAVLYINSDGSGRGYLRAAGEHTLERFINDIAKNVTDPEKNISVWERARLHRIAEAKDADMRSELRTRPDVRISPLGDGSDYAPFLDHAGVPALNLGFGGEDEGGIYHSIYDDFYWYTHFSDTKFVYGRALAQTAGTAVMRMADADVIPVSFGDMADNIAHYDKEIHELLDKSQSKTKETTTELDEGVFTASSDPEKPLAAPKREEIPPFINLAPLDNGSAAFTAAAKRFEKALKEAEKNGGEAFASTSVTKLNQQLIQCWQAFLDERGLADRPFFRNMIYAPGAYTGYGVKTLPAVRESLEMKKWAQAEQGAAQVGQVLQNSAKQIEEAAKILEGMTTPGQPSAQGN
ncbi:MAG TPA: transferrin receptor-like dimerization domain-containing protein [Terriglobales bacterium]|nr:transferrin receptor-like dimerization domain-containing protein [Terriglobales bacterium]